MEIGDEINSIKKFALKNIERYPENGSCVQAREILED
jgi:hypothetical protein